ncbi:unnamed protein product, partial [Mesorhabditis belari]|uniref:glutaminase n=1 Tax=Mesorhabditis belari TaxID=2138241 RepID=A0AAF3FJ74_9BILA
MSPTPTSKEIVSERIERLGIIEEPGTSEIVQTTQATPPTATRGWFQANTTLIKVPSHRTIEQLGAILEKGSTKNLSESLRCLSNPYHENRGREDIVFDLFKLNGTNEASIGKLITVLKGLGLRRDDPRLKEMMLKLRTFTKLEEELNHEMRDPNHWKLPKDQFIECISPSTALISQALQNNLVIPCWPIFTEKIKNIYLMCKEVRDGQCAQYIPQLARGDPEKFGVSICTVDGQKASWGDSKIPFCVQSVSKAFNYAIAASELGANFVHDYVGQEPSGRFFNEICLDPNGKPHNPMVNSGAIVVTSMIQPKLDTADRFEHVLTEYRKIAGGEYVGFNNATFLSERSSADRNHAIAYFLKENKCFPEGVASLTETLDFYFQLCSLEATCETMSVMAATLANGGVCPMTGERCIAPGACRDVLSLMYSCGMYDASGQFSFSVGLPAKSGVSGIMIVVVPNVMGIALWSPPLDKMGNSSRGVAFSKELVKQFNFHNYDCLLHTESTKFDPRRRDTRERDQCVPVLFAARDGDMAAIRRLYMQGADLSVSDYDQRTPLHLAACEGHLEMVRFLVSIAKVDATVKDRWGLTATDDARNFGQITCVEFLEAATQGQSISRKSSSEDFSLFDSFNDSPVSDPSDKARKSHERPRFAIDEQQCD